MEVYAIECPLSSDRERGQLFLFVRVIRKVVDLDMDSWSRMVCELACSTSQRPRYPLLTGDDDDDD